MLFDNGKARGAASFVLRPRFVGRGAELAALEARFEEVRSRREPALVVLSGEAGVGKTRLVKELSRRLATRGARLFAGNGSSVDGRPYSGFVRILQTRLGLRHGASAETIHERLAITVGELLPASQAPEVIELLAIVLGAEAGPDAGREPEHLPVESRTFLAFKRFFQADAASGPLVLCLDELEQAGTETLRLVQYLVAGLAHAPVMLLGVTRPELFSRMPELAEDDSPAVRIEVGPLAEGEASALFVELLSSVDGLPPRLLDMAAKLGGVPRALVELVRLLVESDVLRPSGARFRVDEEALGRMRMPLRHVDLVEARLQRLRPAEREILDKAACCGPVFWLDAVVALVRTNAMRADQPDGPTLDEIAATGEKTRQYVEDVLDRLAAREWIVRSDDTQVPGETQYSFPYPPLWDVVYGKIAEPSRRRYHRVVARWLELRPEGRDEEAQERIGHHLERAGQGEQAATRYRRAADTARARFLNDIAIRLYHRALDCLGEGDLSARIHLWHDLGSVYELKGEFDAALAAFERMVRLSWVLSSRAKAAVAYNKMGRVWRRKGDLEVALDYLTRALDLFEKAQDERGVAASLDDIGNTLWQLGRYDEAFEKITAGLQRRRRAGDPRSIAQSLSNLGNLQRDRGKLTEAENCHREALLLRRQVRDRAGAVVSLNNLAVVAFERRDRDAARKGWEQALSEATDIGALPLQAIALNNLGEMALEQGKREEARHRLEETLALGRELSDRSIVSEACRNLGLVELATGDLDRARRLAQEAVKVAEEGGLKRYAGRAYLALAEIHAATLFDDASEQIDADSLFARGVRVFRELGNEGELARGLERYGRYKLERGDVPAGRGLLGEAQDIQVRLGLELTETRLLGEIV